ncbi:MAG: ornithine cyclodeaminase [Lachnospiraceae bacterium]|nr:ornithine cyclodeaminase [Lachnospiraceae bacterium]
MKIITFEDIKKMNISPILCYQWVSDMIQSKSTVILPPKISMKPTEGVFCNVMPCIIRNTAEISWGGVKIVTRYPDRQPSLDSRLLLMNADNGEILALMDANWITAMRTGAVAAHSILLFAKDNFFKIGMLGLGNTARATLLVLAEMIPDRELHIKLMRHKGQEILFAERFASYKQLHFEYVDSNEVLVRGSDVVISAATFLSEDLCSDDCFSEGVLVVPIHTRGFTNCDLFFDKIYADDYGHVCHFKNFKEFKQFAEVSDVVNGTAEGRTNDKERILAYNIGVSMHDINYAANIYQMLENSRLMEVDLQTPKDKFWI